MLILSSTPKSEDGHSNGEADEYIKHLDEEESHKM